MFATVNTLSGILRHPLNRERKLAALARYVRWQVGSRLALGPVVVSFVDGMLLCVSPGMTGATGNIYSGLHEFSDMAFVLHALRPDDLVLDVGANVGSYTLLAAAAGARVIAFEPAPEAFERLALNVRLNDLSDVVQLHRSAVGARRGVVRFTVGLDTVNHVATSADALDAMESAVTTIDDTVGTTREPSSILIKIDVEGYEAQVLAGAAEALSSPAVFAVILELNGSGRRFGVDDGDLHATMVGHGFDAFSYDAFARQLTALPDKGSGRGNTLYVRDGAWAQARVESARPFCVQGRPI